MVQLSAARFSCITILWVNLFSFAAIMLCVASWRVFVVVVYFVIDRVRKLLFTLSYGLIFAWLWFVLACFRISSLSRAWQNRTKIYTILWLFKCYRYMYSVHWCVSWTYANIIKKWLQGKSSHCSQIRMFCTCVFYSSGRSFRFTYSVT
jgi:hypothetical protein